MGIKILVLLGLLVVAFVVYKLVAAFLPFIFVAALGYVIYKYVTSHRFGRARV